VVADQRVAQVERDCPVVGVPLNVRKFQRVLSSAARARRPLRLRPDTRRRTLSSAGAAGVTTSTTSFGTSSGSARNIPKYRTVDELHSKPNFMCAPHRRPINALSALSRKKIFSSLTRDGGPSKRTQHRTSPTARYQRYKPTIQRSTPRSAMERNPALPRGCTLPAGSALEPGETSTIAGFRSQSIRALTPP